MAEQVYYEQVVITGVRHLSDRWIHFSLETTDSKARVSMKKYYQYREEEGCAHFVSGATVWKVGLYQDSDIMKSIERGGTCSIF